jgi:predicted Zn finger-like uncharacterized protein
MKFVCDRCQTKYAVADEKVRGKILKVRCKSCSNIITVREEPAAGSQARRAPSAPVPTLGSPAPRAPAPATKPPAVPAPSRPPPLPPATHLPLDDGLQWYLALDGNRSGPFTRKQLVDKVAPFSPDADLHVWNEQLGNWRPPSQVPAIAADLAARKPSGPPPFPGAPRRPTSKAIPTLAAAAPRPTGAHAVTAPIGPGVGLKLPPPGRRATGPLSRPAVLAAAGALAPASSRAEPDKQGLDVDPSTLLETPVPQAHVLHALASTNGFGGGHAPAGKDSAVPHGMSSAAAASDRSDVLNTLNLAAAGASGASPRLLSSESIVGWKSGSAEASGARQRGSRIVLVFLGVIAVIVVVLALNVTKKPKQTIAQAPQAPQAAAAADPMAGVAEKAADPPHAGPVVPTPVAPVASSPLVVPLVPPPDPRRGKAKAPRGAHARGARPVTVASTEPAPNAPAADANAARFRDTSRPGLAITGGGGSSRPAPAQADISRVINNNRGGIKNCYQRALLRDNSLTHGKITVQLSIGISGRVKHVGIDGPPQFRQLDPCIKEVVGRWAFPQAGDEYGTEFAYVFQGNE